MFCSIQSAVLRGIDGIPVKVEVDISGGLPSFDMVGLVNSEIREARERVRSALKNSGISLPPKRITVNLSPAAIRKEGTGFDLPVAVGILCAMGLADKEKTANMMFSGELSLNGDIEPVNGILSFAFLTKNLNLKYCVVPRENAAEAAIVKGISVVGIGSLKDIIDLLINDNFNEYEYIEKEGRQYQCDDMAPGMASAFSHEDFSLIYGQAAAKRAALIAVSGMHHFLMTGSPGTGKTMIASAIPSIMPKPEFDECVEITKIYSASGILKDKKLITSRPFRAPHHSITAAALTGGGRRPKCGEVTLAHNGVLFLDEFAEFKRDVTDTLRQPLESGVITVSRVDATYIYPAGFMLVAAMNPCKCGYYPDRTRCGCSDADIVRYKSRISTPVMDRIDVCMEVEPVRLEDIGREAYDSADGMRRRIEIARNMQRERFKHEDIRFNGQMKKMHIGKYCAMTDDAEKFLKSAYDKLSLTVRGYHKVIKTARSIADTEGEDMIHEAHIAEALGYRPEEYRL